MSVVFAHVPTPIFNYDTRSPESQKRAISLAVSLSISKPSSYWLPSSSSLATSNSEGFPPFF